MDAFLIDHELALRAGIFVGVLMICGLAEAIRPRRSRRQGRWRRWPINAAMVALGAIGIRLLVPVLTVAAALWADRLGLGLLNWCPVPEALAIILGFVALDFSIYAQHVALHHVPVLWRLHKIHHTDLDLDVTSALRFHPGEFIFSAAYKGAIAVAVGAPAAAVILVEVVLNAMAVFNHANLRLPGPADRLLRRVFVTPDVHIVHHSAVETETNSNFGFNLILWDKLFGTYKPAPKAGPVALTIGLSEEQDGRRLGLRRLLAMPFDRANRKAEQASVEP